MTLSPREVQIIRHLANGNTDAEIASALKITKSTVSSHKRRIFAKMGVNNNMAAVMGALARGYLHVERLDDEYS